MTSSSACQSTPALRRTSSMMGIAPRSSVRIADKAPAYRPKGVRTASQRKASGILVELRRGVAQRGKEGGLELGERQEGRVRARVEGGDHFAANADDGNGDRAQAQLELLVDDREAVAAGRFDRRAKAFLAHHAMGRMPRGFQLEEVGLEVVGGEAGEQHGAERRAVRGKAAAD